MLDYKFNNLFGCAYNIGNLQFSKNSDDILYSPVGNKVIVYNLKEGSSKAINIEGRSNIHKIEITSKNLLVLVDIDGFCKLVNLSKNTIVGHFNFREKVYSLSSSNCGSFLAASVKNGVKIFKLPSKQIKQIEPLILVKSYLALHTDNVKSITWSMDNRFILTSGKDCVVRLLNLFKIQDYSPLTFSGHKKKIINSFFTNEHKNILTLSADGTLFVWKYIEEQSKGFLLRRKILTKKNCLDSENYNLNDDDNTFDIEMINENLNENKNLDDANVEEGIETFSEFENYSDFEKDIYKGRFILDKKQQFIINSKITRAEINNKTNIFVISTENGMFSIYDSQTFENKYSLQITDTKINSLSISNNGVQLAFGSKKAQQVLVWDWKSESYNFKTQGHDYDITALALSTDSNFLVSGSGDGKIKVWETNSANCLFTFTQHNAKVTDLKFPANKLNLFVSSSNDGTVRAFDLIKFNNFRTMTSPEPTLLTCVSIDNNAEIVCAGSHDPFSIYVWNLKTSDIVDILSGHTGPISSIAFSTTSDLLVSGSWDKTVRLWSLYSKRGDYESFDINGEVLNVDLSSNSKQFSACNIKGEIHTWDIENSVLISKIIN